MTMILTSMTGPILMGATMTDRERYMALVRAIEVHRQLIESAEVSRQAADDALYQVHEILLPQCTGGCCG
jgi:hypothetical protein